MVRSATRFWNTVAASATLPVLAMPRLRLNRPEPIRTSDSSRADNDTADSGAMVKARAKPRAVSHRVMVPTLVKAVMEAY